MECLPPELLTVIFTFLPVEVQYLSRTVNKRWRDTVPRGKCSSNELLLWATEYNNTALCCLAQELRANNYKDMLLTAAENGHASLCILAEKWGGIEYNPWDNDMYYLFEKIFDCACDSGHTHICKIWGEWTLYDNNANSTSIDFDGLFYNAIVNDKEDMIQLAREWDDNFGDYLEYINSERAIFNNLLELAAAEGNEKYCKIAKAHGATDFNGMCHWASKNSDNIRKFAVEWKNEMITK